VIETVSAGTTRFGGEDALELASKARNLLVTKGQEVVRLDLTKEPSREELLSALLGPTGNLRAPAFLSGKNLVVGFSEDLYEEVLG
jgi:arsenate reductase-like glutaredoxin family protein